MLREKNGKWRNQGDQIMAIIDMVPFAGQKKGILLKNICLNSYFLDAFLATIQFAGTH